MIEQNISYSNFKENDESFNKINLNTYPLQNQSDNHLSQNIKLLNILKKYPTINFRLDHVRVFSYSHSKCKGILQIIDTGQLIPFHRNNL